MYTRHGVGLVCAYACVVCAHHIHIVAYTVYERMKIVPGARTMRAVYVYRAWECVVCLSEYVGAPVLRFSFA